LILGDGKVYPHKGKFYALDRNLDLKTGSIRYEVTFPNPGNNLRPGQFGKVRRRRHQKDALIVPQEAVSECRAIIKWWWSTRQQGAHPSGENGERIGAMWEVTDGLKPGERVVVQASKSSRRCASHGEGLDAAGRRVGSKSDPAQGALSRVGIFCPATDRCDRHRNFDER